MAHPQALRLSTWRQLERSKGSLSAKEVYAEKIAAMRSGAGTGTDPAWLKNLEAHPTDVTVEIGSDTVAADAEVVPEPDPDAKQRVMALVDELGFDSFDAGGINDSWRMQPGSPHYTHPLDASELEQALADASPGARRSGGRSVRGPTTALLGWSIPEPAQSGSAEHHQREASRAGIDQIDEPEGEGEPGHDRGRAHHRPRPPSPTYPTHGRRVPPRRSPNAPTTHHNILCSKQE